MVESLRDSRELWGSSSQGAWGQSKYVEASSCHPCVCGGSYVYSYTEESVCVLMYASVSHVYVLMSLFTFPVFILLHVYVSDLVSVRTHRWCGT